LKLLLLCFPRQGRTEIVQRFRIAAEQKGRRLLDVVAVERRRGQEGREGRGAVRRGKWKEEGEK
jgi:hypothetical protein